MVDHVGLYWLNRQEGPTPLSIDGFGRRAARSMVPLAGLLAVHEGKPDRHGFQLRPIALPTNVLGWQSTGRTT